METISDVFPIHLQQASSWSPIQVHVPDRSQASIIIMCLLSSITPFELGGLGQTPQSGFDPLDLSWTLSCLTRLWNTFVSPVENLVSWYPSEQCLLMFLEILRGIMLQLVSTKNETVNISRTSVLSSRIIATLLLLKPEKLVSALQKSVCLALFETARLFQCSTALSEAFDEHLLPILVESRSYLMNFQVDLEVCVSGSLRQ